MKSYAIKLIPLILLLLTIIACGKKDLQWNLPRTNSLDSLSNDSTDKIPSLETLYISSISMNTASSGGMNIIDNGSSISSKGVCWGINSNPTIDNSHTIDGSGNSDFGSQIIGLSGNTAYFVRAYATNIFGTGYGGNITFTTTSVQLPTISTITPFNITINSATSGGNIISNGSAAIINSGICWSTSVNPTILDTYTSDGSTIGNFQSQISNLNPSTTYHIRAYATTSIGTGYGQNISFTTTSPPVPTLTTTNVSNISFESASSGGNITSNGGAAITSSGICWSTSANPTIANSHTTDGSSIGSFQSQLTNLNPSTTYYVRAYATSVNGTGYGQSVSFTSSQTPTATLVSTNNCSTLSGITSLYQGMNGTSDQWGISSSGYSGSCWVAPDPANSGQLGTAIGTHYVQFNRNFTNQGYIEFWLQTNNPGFNNLTPTIFVDGSAQAAVTAIGGQTSSFYFIQVRSALILPGNHTIKIQFNGSYYVFKIDEINFFEY